ncbi:BGTF surface domain-containing protein [Natrinema versiforme]|uniref:BGTF surface domain-containing protein n=1 Tax=Natrinema versiforme TaxID=88724 RepID=UPI000A9AB818|nr:BGTF surface domain-containing protein [Natrinema versiforme]
MSSDDDGNVEIDTSPLEAGNYFLEGGDATPSNQFEIVVQSFSATDFEDDTVDDDETVDFEFNSNRGTYAVNVTADGLEDEDLDSIFNTSTDNNDFDVTDYDNSNDSDDEVIKISGISDADDYTANFTDIDTGEYTFDFESNDTSATSNDTITVTEGEDGSLSFGDEVIETRTNTAEIPVELEETDQGYLRVGTMEDAGYEVYLLVEDDDNNEGETGEVVVEMDTIAAANNTSSVEDAFSPADSDDSVSLEVVHNESANEHLGSGDYPLSLSTDINETLTDANDATDFSEDDLEAFDDSEEDTSYMTLENRQTLAEDAVTAHTAPQGNLNDITDELDDDETLNDLIEEENITATDTVADGDGMLVSLETEGLHSYFEEGDTFEDINSAANSNGQDFNLTIEGEDSGPNADPPVWTTSDTVGSDETATINDSVEVVAANQSEGTVLFNVDYSGFGSEFETGDSYDTTFNVNYDWEYASEEAEDNEENEEAVDSFDLEQREFELDDSNEELPASATATVTGETNVAPGTEVSDRLRSAGNFTQSNDAYVADDGTFEIGHDLSEYEAGIDYTLEADEEGGTEDDLEGTTIPGDALQSFDYDVSTDPAEPTVGDTVTGTVSVDNPNDAQKSEDVEFVFDGETLYNDTVDLDSGASDTIVDGATLLETAEKGDYEWELIVDGETEDSGTVTVAEDDSGSDDSGSDDSGSDDSGSDDSGSDDSGSDDSGSDDSGSDDSGSSDDGTPGFGVGVALVALLGAAMLALRRQN